MYLLKLIVTVTGYGMAVPAAIANAAITIPTSYSEGRFQ